MMYRCIALLALLFLSFGLNASLTSQARAEEESFTLCAGDVLQVTVWKEEGLDREALVLPDGSISFPLIGSLNVQGKTLATTQNEIKDKLQSVIPDASVSVIVKAPLGHTVNVLGQVTKPGEIVMNHRTTVMQALSQAGGLTPFASERNIRVLRHNGTDGQDTSIDYNYNGIASGDDLKDEIVLVPGDVIIVPTAGLLW